MSDHRAALALCLALAACAPSTARHTPEHPGGHERAALAMVDAPGKASAHGFSYSADRAQPYK